MARSNPYALNFNGTSSQVNIASNAGLNFVQTSKFTIEMWFKANSIGTNMTLFNKQRATTNEFIISIDVQVDGYVLFAVGKQNVSAVNVKSKKPIQTGKWYHIAAVSDGTNIHLYIDGTIQSSAVISVTGTTQSVANAIIGHWYYNSTSYFNGEIDEFRMWNINKSSEEINKNKSYYMQGSEQNLILLYRMNEGTGSTIGDSSPSNIVGNLVNTTWVEGQVDIFGNTQKFLIVSEDKYYSLIARYLDNAIPAMTSNNTPSGIADASSTYTTFYPWKAFDRVVDPNGWVTNINVLTGWLSYEFNSPKIISAYSVQAGTTPAGRSPKTWTFEGWTGSDWVVLDSRQNQPVFNESEYRLYAFENKDSYKKYRINVTANQGAGDFLAIGDFGMYEREKFYLNLGSKESDFIKNGMNEGNIIELDDEFSERRFSVDISTQVGSGKVFKKKIDTTKITIKKAEIT